MKYKYRILFVLAVFAALAALVCSPVVYDNENDPKSTNYKPPVTVNGGTADKNKYAIGATVMIIASTPPASHVFSHWTSDSSDINFADSAREVTTFIMPARPVEITAVFTDTTAPPPTDCQQWSSEWEVTANATCEAEGSRKKVCMVQGTVHADDLVETIPILTGETACPPPPPTDCQQWSSEWEVTANATCEADGSRKKVCMVQGTVHAEDLVETIPMLTGETNCPTLPTIFTIKFDINFVGAGGTVTPTSGKTGSAGKLLILPTPTIADVRYAFAGWFTETADGDSVSLNTVFYNDDTIYARWLPVKYNITYNLNGGGGGVENSYYTFETLPVTLPTPDVRNGYTFDGWFTDNNFTETAVSPIPVGSMEDKEYWAKWTPIPYTITYDLNEGQGAEDRDYTIEDLPLTLPEPTRSGYDFDGWTGSNGTTPQITVTIPADSVGDKTYTANWTKSICTITFNATGGTVSPASSMTNAIGELLTMPTTPTRTDGAFFKGWFTAKSGGDMVDPNTVFYANDTIYARWESQVFTDTRDNNRPYKTVVMGEKIWMAENLNYEIPINEDGGEDEEGEEDGEDGEDEDIRSWCYDNDSENCKKYGRLYTWYAAKVACPTGWRLPDDAEWLALMIYANTDPDPTETKNNAGTKLKSAAGGWNDGAGTDDYGFTALPGGNIYNGSFANINYAGFWWSLTEDVSSASYTNVNAGSENLHFTFGSKTNAHSVRCVKE